MTEDSARDVSTARAAYEARPWLKHYPSYLRPEITPQFTNALDMFLKTVQTLPEQAAIHYFDQTMSYGELDRKRSALQDWVPLDSHDVVIGVTPFGEVGERIIKGPQVVAGYWEKPEETANAIRDGYLYTGDVARMDEDGWFYIVDRKKDLIIVSGYKVWPRDVEDVLYQHPAVRQAAVVGMPDPYRGETVVAYVALKSGYEETMTPEALIEFCKQRLANYKYPRKIEIMKELPQTLTGKFLRRELRGKAQQ